MPSLPVPPDYITNGYGYPMQTTSCTWPYVVPIGEDPAAHGHWCAFTDLYHAIPYHACWPCTNHALIACRPQGELHADHVLTAYRPCADHVLSSAQTAN